MEPAVNEGPDGPRQLDVASTAEETAAMFAVIRSHFPGFLAAVGADARMAIAHRGDRVRVGSHLQLAFQVVRLALVTDAFLALVCYRAKAACQARRIPFVPRLLHRVAISMGQIAIGDPVLVAPGVYLPHGQVVVDGLTRIEAGTVVGPFVTLGLRHGGVVGPTVGPRAFVGTGAKVIGPVSVGEGASIGANAVILGDVPDGATAVGVWTGRASR